MQNLRPSRRGPSPIPEGSLIGNRANIIFTAGERISPCVYLHWNGGPESVYAFLAELDRRGVRPDADYECARFIALVAEFFGDDGLSLGVVSTSLGDITAESLGTVYTDPSDNGFYVVDRTNPAPVVRRFVERYGSLAELDPLVALTERSEAQADAQYLGISERLRLLAEWRTAAMDA